MNRYLQSNSDFTTKDIMYNLTGILPVAVEQIDTLPFFDRLKNDVANLTPYEAAQYIAGFVQKNIVYKEDGLIEQKIQTPYALLTSGVGDCKSFALLIAAFLTAVNIPNGFRFAQYPGNNDFTHVYNFIDINGEIHTFDACMPDLTESDNATKTKDMKISIIGSTPFAHESKTTISPIGNMPNIGSFNTLFAAPMRIAFLGLLRLNYRGYATALANIIEQGLPFAQNFWNQFGGNYSSLISAVNAGKNKSPFFGGGAAYDALIAQDTLATMYEFQNFVEYIQNATIAGFVLPPEIPQPIPFNNTALVNLIKQLVQNFYAEQGRLFEQNQPTNLDVETIPLDPGTLPNAQIVTPKQRPGMNSPYKQYGGAHYIGTGGETALALLGAAIPVIMALNQLLNQLGVDTQPGQVPVLDSEGNPVLDSEGNPMTETDEPTWWQSVLNMFGGSPAPGGNVPPGNTPPNNGGFNLSPITLIVIGGGLYLLFRKK
jgi:hypothetical protein